MTVLTWDKPDKVLTTEAWKGISADGAPPGVYTPNMSDDDMLRWKAKLVGKTTDEPRVEIRKTAQNGVQMKIVVDHEGVLLSMNGTAWLRPREVKALQKAIGEALDALHSLNQSEYD